MTLDEHIAEHNERCVSAAARERWVRRIASALPTDAASRFQFGQALDAANVDYDIGLTRMMLVHAAKRAGYQ